MVFNPDSIRQAQEVTFSAKLPLGVLIYTLRQTHTR